VHGLPITPWAGLGVLTAWAAAALLAGGLLLRPRGAWGQAPAGASCPPAARRDRHAGQLAPGPPQERRPGQPQG
jgi:hypothetical protein